MAKISLKGNPINSIGNLPVVGNVVPNFKLVGSDLSVKTKADFAGKKVIYNIFPSLDTDICATSVRKFNQQASSLENTIVLCVSMDLPFAHKRFCATEGIENVVNLSAFRKEGFEKDFGVEIIDGPLAGVLSRAVVVTNENGVVIYNEQVPEIVQEPNYEAALESLL
jgi:thiol peroxidase